MQTLEFGLVKDKLWLYYKDGGEQPETVMVDSIVHKTVTLSNGDKIPTAQFYELCEPALDEEPQQSHDHRDQDIMQLQQDLDLDLDLGDGNEGGSQPSGEFDPVKEMMAGVQFDENGMPIVKNPVKQQHKAQPQQQNRQIQQPQQQIVNQSPLIALVEKSQLKEIEFNIKLQVPVINKVLFNAFLESYPEDEIEILLDHLINKIGQENIKEAIKQKMHQHYKSKKENVTS